MQLTAVRQRSCPACELPVASRSARWCGSCGAPLRPIAAADGPDAGPSDAARDRRHRVALIALAVAVAAGALLVAGPIVDRLPGDDDAVADLEVASPSARVLERVTNRFQPPPPTLADPICLRAAGLDCFRWAVDDPDAGRSHTRVAGDLLLSMGVEGDGLTARRISDGAVAWRAAAVSTEQVVTTEELLLTVDGGVLTARTLEDGQVRWRSDELPDDVTFLAAGQRGAALVLLAFLDAPLLDDGTVVGPLATAVGVDADDGGVRWRTDAVGPAAITPDATLAYVDAEGDLVAVEPDGEERWRVPAVTPGSSGGTWITAGVVTVYSGEDGDRLYRLDDGRVLGVGGTVLASDGQRTVLEVWPGQEAMTTVEEGELDGPAYVLLDADGEPLWRVPSDARGCTLGAELEADLVRIGGCGGSELVLDAADGTVRARTPSVEASDGDVVTFADRLGPYALQPQAPSQLGSAYVLVDTRTDQQVARLPPDSVALTGVDQAAWTHDLGGVAVIQHRGGLVALDLPGEGTRRHRPNGSVTSR